MAVLLDVYVDPQPHTVRALSNTFNVSKPAIACPLNRRCTLDFVSSKPDDANRRSIIIQRVVKGSVFLSDFNDSIATSLEHLDK
jgi:hypothetical protein